MLGIGSGSTAEDFAACEADYERRMATFARRGVELRALLRGEDVQGRNLHPWAAVGQGPPVLIRSWAGSRWIERAATEFDGWVGSDGQDHLGHPERRDNPVPRRRRQPCRGHQHCRGPQRGRRSRPRRERSGHPALHPGPGCGPPPPPARPRLRQRRARGQPPERRQPGRPTDPATPTLNNGGRSGLQGFRDSGLHHA